MLVVVVLEHVLAEDASTIEVLEVEHIIQSLLPVQQDVNIRFVQQVIAIAVVLSAKVALVVHHM